MNSVMLKLNKIKDDANQMYNQALKSSDKNMIETLFRQASVLYGDAISTLLNAENEPEYDTSDPQLIQIKLSLFLNLAASNLKLKGYEGAIKCCDAVIQICNQPTIYLSHLESCTGYQSVLEPILPEYIQYITKASYRRGQCHEAMYNIHQAILDYQYALSLSPHSKEIKSSLHTLEIQTKIKQQNDNDSSIVNTTKTGHNIIDSKYHTDKVSSTTTSNDSNKNTLNNSNNSNSCGSSGSSNCSSSSTCNQNNKRINTSSHTIDMTNGGHCWSRKGYWNQTVTDVTIYLPIQKIILEMIYHKYHLEDYYNGTTDWMTYIYSNDFNITSVLSIEDRNLFNTIQTIPTTTFNSHDDDIQISTTNTYTYTYNQLRYKLYQASSWSIEFKKYSIKISLLLYENMTLELQLCHPILSHDSTWILESYSKSNNKSTLQNATCTPPRIGDVTIHTHHDNDIYKESKYEYEYYITCELSKDLILKQSPNINNNPPNIRIPSSIDNMNTTINRNSIGGNNNTNEWTPGCEWWDRVFEGDETIDTISCSIHTDISQLPLEAHRRAEEQYHTFKTLSPIEQERELHYMKLLKQSTLQSLSNIQDAVSIEEQVTAQYPRRGEMLENLRDEFPHIDFTTK